MDALVVGVRQGQGERRRRHLPPLALGDDHLLWGGTGGAEGAGFTPEPSCSSTEHNHVQCIIVTSSVMSSTGTKVPWKHQEIAASHKSRLEKCFQPLGCSMQLPAAYPWPRQGVMNFPSLG